jgi:hypothetical membrane protein
MPLNPFFKKLILKYQVNSNSFMTSKDAKIAGTLLTVGGIQFVLALIIAESIYPNYSIANNYISDLGVWGKPSAAIFNPALMIFGISIIAASVFIKRHFHLGKLAYLYAIAGAGSLGVGIFPENTFILNGVPVLHSISALLAFVVGGLAALVTYKITKSPFRYISAFLGAFTLVAFVVFLATRDASALGIGAGGLERMVAYPTTLGLIGFGGYLLGNQD